MVSNFSQLEYAGWLENALKNIVELEPVSIAIEMIGADDEVYTCYYNVSADDRARLIGGMQDDDRVEFIRNNRDTILEILKGDDDDEESEDGWTTQI